MATLRIHGEIVSVEEKEFFQLFFGGADDSVSFRDVNDFIASIPSDDNKISVSLDSRGGDVAEGWKIYDALRATGKEISSEVIGECASMATIILLAAPKERRAARPHASLLIHNPYIPAASGELNADELRNLADRMQAEQDKMLDLYVDRTGATREQLQAYMDEAKWMNMDEAMELGFISTIITPASAKASGTKSKKMSFIEKLKALISSEEAGEHKDEQPVAMELSTATGGTLTVEREEGEPQVGDKASPDGTHKMPDGKTITVEDGVITEIEAEEAPEEEVETLRRENEELRRQLEEANAKATDAEAKAKTVEELRILNAVKVAGGIDKVLAGIKSNGRPEGRRVEGKNAGEKYEESALKRHLAEVREKGKK